MNSVSNLNKIQQLVLDIRSIERNHNIPDTDTRENVVEHSMAVAMLCWRIYDELKPDLNLEKILKYCLAHDFLERGLKNDVNTYASATEKEQKKIREQKELIKLKIEFSDFKSMTEVIENYENMSDQEARYVWCVDKMQAIVLGGIDNWRPYERVGITYQQFCDKGDWFVERCPDFLRETFVLLNEQSRKTFYDQPTADTNDSNSH